MAIDSLADLSPDQAYAHKVAVQQLAKYCQEFSCWRKTKRASAALDKSLRAQTLLGPSAKKPAPPAQH